MPMPDGQPVPTLIVAGPTCSGKSALALQLAQRLNGTVINADSMQVYKELRIVTARPTPREEAATPHALYGIRPAAQPGSVAWWRDEALAAIDAARAAQRTPILCGGTGLYLAALTQGLAPIPEPTPEARHEARTLLEDLGPEPLHARLAALDPATAATLRPSDGQRIARAYEIVRSTGIPLSIWQALPPDRPVPNVRLILLDPPRPALRAAIAARFAAMLDAGAIEEVRALLAQNLDPTLPAMRAHGVPELAAYLQADITLPEAQRRATLATGQYTKRQATWFRHRAPVPAANTHMIHARFAGPQQFSEREWTDIESFVIQCTATRAKDESP